MHSLITYLLRKIMKPRSAKNKGVRLQNWVRDQILETFPKLTSDDVRPAIMGQSGMDINLSSEAQQIFPWAVECKNTERVRVWDAFDQAEENCPEGLNPLVIIKRNGSAPLAVLDAEFLLEHIGKLRSK